MLVHVGSHQTRNFAVKGMGVLVYTKLNKSHLCAFAKKKKKKSHGILDCIKRSVASRSGKVILPLSLYSSLVRPQLECCVQFPAPQYKTGLDILEKV